MFSNELKYKTFRTKKMLTFLVLDTEIEDKQLTWIDIYASNGDSPELYIKVTEITEDFNKYTCIFVAILIWYHSKIWISIIIYTFKTQELKTVISMKELLSLVDPFRELNETLRNYTWCEPHPLKQAGLDFFPQVSASDLSSVQNVEILQSYRSDHVWGCIVYYVRCI